MTYPGQSQASWPQGSRSQVAYYLSSKGQDFMAARLPAPPASFPQPPAYPPPYHAFFAQTVSFLLAEK